VRIALDDIRTFVSENIVRVVRNYVSANIISLSKNVRTNINETSIIRTQQRFFSAEFADGSKVSAEKLDS